MVSVMVIENEVFGSCVEGAWVDLELKMLRLYSLYVAFFGE